MLRKFSAELLSVCPRAQEWSPVRCPAGFAPARPSPLRFCTRHRPALVRRVPRCGTEHHGQLVHIRTGVDHLGGHNDVCCLVHRARMQASEAELRAQVAALLNEASSIDEVEALALILVPSSASEPSLTSPISRASRTAWVNSSLNSARWSARTCRIYGVRGSLPTVPERLHSHAASWLFCASRAPLWRRHTPAI